MTRDGFTFLCIGFTGKEAARWKEAYINAFNKMEQALIEPGRDPQSRPPAPVRHQDPRPDARPHPRRASPTRTEQVVCNYLAVETLDAANPRADQNRP
ncbi:Rha family transcriptional regulator (plasmid) [Pseudomonas aeruginosa]